MQEVTDLGDWPPTPPKVSHEDGGTARGVAKALPVPYSARFKEYRRMSEQSGHWRASQAAAFGASCQGEAHRQKGTLCQDAWRVERCAADGAQDCLILAAADGHGAAMHDLSGIGSDLAVCAAVTELQTLVQEHAGDAARRPLELAFRTEFPRRVVKHWRDAVAADALNRLEHTQPGLIGPQKLYNRYGSTLLAALVLESELLIASIGDGDILFLHPAGDVVYHLDQDVPELLGTVTFSLASNDPELLFQTKVLPRGAGGMLMLSTDGLVNSFLNDTYFLAFSIGLQDRIRTVGFDHIAADLPHWLEYFSAHGSKDDITLLLAWLEAPPAASAAAPAAAPASAQEKML
jgi:serine/threonine protein phosphatase PrpC